MSNPTRWVGIDLRRRRSQIAIIDDEGELTFSRPIVNDVTRFASCSATRTHPMWRLRRPTAGSGSPRCSRRPATTCTSHTRCVRRRSPRPGSRPTRSDAKTLTHLLRCALLPEAYIAPPELRDLRELLRHRATLTRMPTAVKNRVRALLARQGIRQEHSDLFGKGGHEFLTSLASPDVSRQRLDSLLALIADFDREITATTREIDARAKADERVGVLCQIRGVGRYTAMLVIAEVGDVKRFPTARQLCAWAGLAPTVAALTARRASGTSPARARPHCAGR